MSDNPEDYELVHYGVKGMKWGVRRENPGGVSNRTNRAAKKDAAEFTKAKMYYGEGAGTRRKLIKARVNERSKDPGYKAAFDSHVSGTNMERRAEQARGKRARTDVSNKVKKTARGVGHMARGNGQYASLAAAGLFTAGAIAYNNGGKEVVLKYARVGLKHVNDARAARAGAAFLKQNGFKL